MDETTFHIENKMSSFIASTHTLIVKYLANAKEQAVAEYGERAK